MAQSRTYSQAKNKLWFKCRTRTRWLSGYVTTTRRRLADLFNSEDCFLAVAADEVSVQDRPNSQGGPRALGHVNIATSTILFAIPMEDAPRGPDLRIRSTRKMDRAIIGVGPYEVEGDLFLMPEARPREVLASIASPFIVLADVLIRSVGDPGAVEKCEAILVNRQHVDYIASAPAAEAT